jgi:lipopolysaccharide transport system ATP-binding protein
MSDTIIKIENVSKQYRLGLVGTGTLYEDLNRWWALARGKEDPTLKIGEENKRSSASDKYMWALKDINLEIKQGEVLGIIGKNGAGKSTLLKLLSRVTSPTTGRIRVNGRIASLLEVGTGFHPELTGRENIFLNGTILGMTKREIKAKFDEIVEFSGVEKYIDTPVKRYSSGMYVRLAFAVAAHLESEIMIVDEVLAVGDAEFQKKCLGKMDQVSKAAGRTILFVSHNMNSLTSLCKKGIQITKGKIQYTGNIFDVVDKYLIEENTSITNRKWNDGELPSDDIAELISARIINKNHQEIKFPNINEKIGVEYYYRVKKKGNRPIPNIHVFTAKGEYAFVTGAPDVAELEKVGVFKAIMWIPEKTLNTNTYVIGIALSSLSPVRVHFFITDALIFETNEDINERGNGYNQHIPGIIRPNLDWNVEYQ